MPTIDQIIAAEEVLRQARINARLLHPGDRVLLHRARPGETVCSLSYEATVVSTRNTQPTQVYPTPWWEVTVKRDTGEVEVFRCSGNHMVLVGNDVAEEEAA